MKTKSTQLKCKIKLKNGCFVFFNDHQSCPEGVDHILIRSKRDFMLINATCWGKNPVEILGAAFQKIISNFDRIDPTTLFKGDSGEISVPCQSNPLHHMVIQDCNDGEFTSYVRFVDNENKELAFYDIEQEMGDAIGYPHNIEAVGAVMQILDCGYTLFITTPSKETKCHYTTLKS